MHANVIAVDPGQATTAVVIGDARTGSVCHRMAFQSKFEEHAVEAQAKRTLDMAATVFAWIHPRIVQPSVFVVEDYVGGLRRGSAMTPYYRGRFDQLLEIYAMNAGMQILRVLPSWVKALCHPSGKAVDKGRKTDLEFRSALNCLDSIIRVQDLSMIVDPPFTVVGGTSKKWRDARLHTLDAAAIFALYVGVYSAATGQGSARPRAPQRTILDEVAARWTKVR